MKPWPASMTSSPHSTRTTAAPPIPPEQLVLHDPLGTPADGATQLQPAVPMVCRAVAGRPRVVPTVFSKNRDRLLEGDIAAAFMTAVLNLPQVKALLSDEHFSVDGTLIKAWASMKSFRRKDGNDEPPAPGRNGERNFRG